MSRPRNTRLSSTCIVTRSHSALEDHEYAGKTSVWGNVTTPHGIVWAMSDAISDLCRYDVVAGGRQYIYYEDGQRTKRGLARRANDLARDAMQRAGGAFRRKG